MSGCQFLKLLLLSRVKQRSTSSLLSWLPEFEVIDELIKRCEEIKSAIPNPDAVLIFSCRSRIDSIGPLVHEEIARIKKVFNAPTVGFFSNGEIAPAYKGKLDIHNNTVVCVVIKEK